MKLSLCSFLSSITAARTSPLIFIRFMTLLKFIGLSGSVSEAVLILQLCPRDLLNLLFSKLAETQVLYTVDTIDRTFVD